ncbi:MAG: alpha/beta hydrolase [Alphaproteobacteria bacterium]
MTDPIFRDYDRAGLDRQYDNRGNVPDFQTYLDRWVADSAAARRDLTGALDLAFGPDPAERLDLFVADGAGSAPVHMFFHGGYWRALGKDDFSYVARPLVAAGAMAVVVNYGLIPAIDMDQLVRQCRAAVAWTYRNAAAHGGDPERIHVSGHSAGGHLVAMLAATDWLGDFGLPADVVRGGLALSGLFDLEPIRLCFLNDELGLTPDQVRRNSPITMPPRVPMAMAIAYGGDETAEYARQSAAYADLLRRNDKAPELRTIAARHHMSVATDLGDADSEVFELIAAQMGL